MKLFAIVEKKNLTSFGKRVAELRRRNGWSQEELAHKSELHRTYVGGMERGERNISLLNIHRLAAALGVAVVALFAADLIDLAGVEREDVQTVQGRRINRLL